ncbi:hypothetical protein CVT25_001647, partial [Psilocybe cyanescens]
LPSLKITFPYEPGEHFDAVNERCDFWDSPDTLEWFKAHGYTLYQRVWVDEFRTTVTRPPVVPDITFTEADYPYAHYDTEFDLCPDSGAEPLRASDECGKIVFAQDSLLRHVAIKLVRADTDEYRVLQFLNQQKWDVLKENCVIPVLEMLPIEGFWFAVMPRWGINISLPEPQYVHEVITIVHSVLTDMKFENVLVNHVSDIENMDGRNSFRKDMRSKKLLSYAVFDFDFSTMLSADANVKECRLPYHRSWGTFNIVDDTASGEFDYSPFILDVGVLGARLAESYQHLTRLIPMLAPLFDMMTHWDLDRRFTAYEALQFFEEHILSKLSEAVLYTDFTLIQFNFCEYRECNRWKGFPPDFVERWKAYRVAPYPWRRRLLRSLCERDYFCHFVPKTRLFFFRLFSVPHWLYRWIVPPIEDVI